MKKYIVGSKEVTLVNSQDEVTGKMDIFEAHRAPCHLHRASSVWVFRASKAQSGRVTKSAKYEVLLQRRSEFKPIGATWWGNGICANVRPDESYVDCAVRRLEGEIGVKDSELQSSRDANIQSVRDSLKPLFKFEYKAFGNDEFSEHELDQVFFMEYDASVVPNPDEVSDVVWVDWTSFKQEVKNKKTEILNAEESLGYSIEELKDKTPPVEIEIDGKKLLMAPWTLMMVSKLDESLSQIAK